MKILKTLRNYLCYCGIEKDEYKALKKDAYISNYKVWRVLHCLMVTVFAALYICSLTVDIMQANRIFYLLAFLYAVAAAGLFCFVLKEDSLIAQLLIYLSISLLYVFGALITQNKPDSPATTFIVLLVIAPMFMIDKPYFMGIELGAASIIYIIWMHGAKTHDAWKMDVGNTVVFAVVGFFIHVIANSIRIKEFVLSRRISIQKDTDELTGLKNKDALTRAINEFFASDKAEKKGILFMLDIDRFKAVNDTYGHDVGDSVIHQFGVFLGDMFAGKEIVGRFGGDEFIVFVKDTDDASLAEATAQRIVEGAAAQIRLPDEKEKVGISIGIALYQGLEQNYSEIFKKADIALYKVKANKKAKDGTDGTAQFEIYLQDAPTGSQPG